MRADLKRAKCKPCEGGVKPLNEVSVRQMLREISEWFTDDNATTIARTFTFKNFSQAIAFVTKVAAIAEKENHHPNIHVHDYKRVTVSLTTHAIGGLSENDFIVAAKIDAL